MHKIKKRIFSLINALLLITLFGSNCCPVYAEEQSVTLTIHCFDWTVYSTDNPEAHPTDANGEVDATWENGKDKYALANVGLSLVKLADLGVNDMDSESAQISIYTKYKLNAAAKALLFPDSSKTVFTADEIRDALDQNKAALEEYAYKYKNDRDKVYGTCTTDSTGTAVLKDITPDHFGLYAVVETEVPENIDNITNAFLLSIPMVKGDGSGWNYDIHIYPKNESSIPDVRKLVKGSDDNTFKDSSTVTPGDTIQYNLIGAIPKVTTVATQLTVFDFEDNLPTGFECDFITVDGKTELKNPESVIVRIYDNRNAANQVSTNSDYLQLEYGTDYTLEYIYNSTGPSSIKVVLTDQGLVKINASADGGHYLSVCYPAIVGDTDQIAVGDEGNRSDVTLTYGRTAASSSSSQAGSSAEGEQEIKDAAIVLTYGFEMQKKFDVAPDQKAGMDQVKFIIQNKSNSKYLIGELREETKPGDYKVTGSTKSKNEATVFYPGEDGKLIIDGVSANEYLVTETQTVKGYAVLDEPIDINIIPKAFQTQPTTAVETGKDQQITDVGVSSVKGQEKATATVNGQPAEIDENGRVPRIKLTILNKKENLANTISNSIPKPVKNIAQKILPKTGDSVNFSIYVLGIIACSFIIFVCYRKFRSDEK